MGYKTHCKRGHELTPDNAIQLYSSNGTKNGRKCRECCNIAQRGWYKSNPKKYKDNAISYRFKHPDKVRNAKLIKKYGITLEEYEAMLVRQSGKCAICSTTEAGSSGTFHVDHDHKSGCVRKLLCMKCNLALGAVDDSVVVLSKMIEYIKEHNGSYI